jgi:hypothetical protein
MEMRQLALVSIAVLVLMIGAQSAFATSEYQIGFKHEWLTENSILSSTVLQAEYLPVLSLLHIYDSQEMDLTITQPRLLTDTYMDGV